MLDKFFSALETMFWGVCFASPFIMVMVIVVMFDAPRI